MRCLALPLLALLSFGVLAPALAMPKPPMPGPTLATIGFTGPAAFQTIARDVTDVAFSVDPSLASGAGLFDDAVRVPSYAPANVAKLSSRLRADLAALRKLPWRTYDVDTQIDVRWIFAIAETLDHALTVEKLYVRRPGQWLEPTANNLLALESYVPNRPDLESAVLAKIPAMVVDMRAQLTAPTRRDLSIGIGLARSVAGVATTHGDAAAAAALTGWIADAEKLTPTQEFGVIGAEAYAWRLQHAMLLPWTPAELLAKATAELARVDAETAAIPAPPAREPTAAEKAAAAALDQAAVLALYDGVSEANRAATLRGGWVSIPAGVGPIRTRPTPDALIPLTGDGGSMNPPPTYDAANVSYWNVEHFDASWSAERRAQSVVGAADYLENGLGTYSAHEGWPGHHLQLAIARLNPDPIRSILPDCAQNEGWALYAEQAFAEHGGLGPGNGARRTVLGGYRARVARVLYDVNIESGTWTLQAAADFKYGTAAGLGTVDEDLLRSINWPTQLVCYFSGKHQILDMKAAAKAKLGAAFDERAFHDTLLQAGSIPLALTRAKILGEPVPDFPPG
ncbi:hypothetical protein LBMAG42_46900 [Deltaproteobacteria bacterium]|nr:hypothetical protein LBMAG42_46900 [Deltaproteobacteria bacterium]